MTKYIVVDFEFNQAFDFTRGKSLPGEWGCPEEIIQIGAVKLDEQLNEVETFDCFVRPKLYRRLHPFVRKVTGIRQGALDRAQYFPEAFDRFAKFIGSRKGVVFCTWGGDDMKAMFRNMLAQNVDSARAGKRYVNVQRVAAAKLGIPGQISLTKAVEAFELPAELEFHDALHDAIYTAEVLRAAVGGAVAEEDIQSFDFNALRRGIDGVLDKVDMKGLMSFAKARFRRELTEEEKLAVSRIYQAGQEKKFDARPKAKELEQGQEQDLGAPPQIPAGDQSPDPFPMEGEEISDAGAC